jgi:hypothetical protein
MVLDAGLVVTRQTLCLEDSESAFYLGPSAYESPQICPCTLQECMQKKARLVHWFERGCRRPFLQPPSNLHKP